MPQEHRQGLYCASAEIAQNSPSQGRTLRSWCLPLYLQTRARCLHPESQRMHFSLKKEPVTDQSEANLSNNGEAYPRCVRHSCLSPSTAGVCNQ